MMTLELELRAAFGDDNMKRGRFTGWWDVGRGEYCASVSPASVDGMFLVGFEGPTDAWVEEFENIPELITAIKDWID